MYQAGVLLHETHPPARRFMLGAKEHQVSDDPSPPLPVATDAHIVTLFQRLGAIRNHHAGTFTLPMDVMRQSYRYLGLTPPEMEVCLRPLVMVGRSQVSLLEFTRILQAADPYQRAHAGDGSGVEERTRVPGATTSVPSAKLYTYPPHPPMQERSGSARTSASRRSPNRSSVLSPPGTKAYDEVVSYDHGVRLYSAELQRLCDMGTFDDGHPSRHALASASTLRSIPVEQIAGLAISQMERDRAREETRTRRLVEVEDILRVAHSPRPTGGSPHGITAAIRPDPVLPEPKPRAPMVPRCASLVPDRYNAGREKRLEQERKSPPRRRTSPARKSSPQSARRPPSAARAHRHTPTTPRAHSRQSQRSPSPSTAKDNYGAKPILVMMTEDPRLLVDEEGGVQVDAVTVKSSRAFRKQRQLDSIVFLQCHLRWCQSALLRRVIRPAVNLLHRVGKAYVVRRKLCELGQHVALRPLLYQAQLHHKPALHAVYRMAPLPKAQEPQPQPPMLTIDTASPQRSPVALVPTAPRPSPHFRSRGPVQQNKQSPSSSGRSTSKQPTSKNASDSSAAPSSPKGSNAASNTALLRKSQQVVVKDKAARVIIHFMRMAAAKLKRKRLSRHVLRDLTYQERQDNVRLIQCFARQNATRYRYEYALRSSRRRSAARVIQSWWRAVSVKLRLRERQQVIALANDWRIRFERYRDVVLRCGLWWRGIKARARYSVRVTAMKRYNENRVAIEKRNDAKFVIARAARWFVCRRRFAKHLLRVQASIDERVLHERRVDAARIIQKVALPYLSRRLVAKKQRALQVRWSRREANEGTVHARSTIQAFFETQAMRIKVLPAKRSAEALRLVIVCQAAVRRRRARNRVKAIRDRLEKQLAAREMRHDAQLVVACIKAAASLNVARTRIAKGVVKQLIEAGVITAEADAAAAAAVTSNRNGGTTRKESAVVATGASTPRNSSSNNSAAPNPKLTKTTSSLRR